MTQFLYSAQKLFLRNRNKHTRNSTLELIDRGEINYREYQLEKSLSMVIKLNHKNYEIKNPKSIIGEESYHRKRLRSETMEQRLSSIFSQTLNNSQSFASSHDYSFFDFLQPLEREMRWFIQRENGEQEELRTQRIANSTMTIFCRRSKRNHNDHDDSSWKGWMIAWSKP